MKEINIGKMNKKIYICTPRTTQDEMGQDIMTYEKGKKDMGNRKICAWW